MSLINVNAMEPSTGTDITLGASGDTITIPSGATFTQSGTMNASAITAGTVATARLGSGTADATTFLRGDQTYAVAGGNNTPSFRVRLSGAQTVADATVTKITYDTEDWDTDSAFASNKFTVPSGGAGKYCINMQTMIGTFTGHLTTWYAIVNYIKKNGTTVCQTEDAQFLAAGSNFYARSSTCVSLAESDYIEGFIYQKNAAGTSKDVDASTEMTFLEGFLLIGA
jgi:hypothetical protein